MWVGTRSGVTSAGIVISSALAGACHTIGENKTTLFEFCDCNFVVTFTCLSWENLQTVKTFIATSEISVTETIMATEIIDPTLTETMVFVETEIIYKQIWLRSKLIETETFARKTKKTPMIRTLNFNSTPAGDVNLQLRQCYAGGLTSLPVQPSAVSAQRCCAIHRRSTTLRPHHRHTRQFPLVEGPGAYSV